MYYTFGVVIKREVLENATANHSFSISKTSYGGLFWPY